MMKFPRTVAAAVAVVMLTSASAATGQAQTPAGQTSQASAPPPTQQQINEEMLKELKAIRLLLERLTTPQGQPPPQPQTAKVTNLKGYALGRPDAPLTMVEFTDLQCPFCRQKYIEVTPILEKYAARPKDLKFILKHWPINTACNAATSRTLHPSACDAAAAVVMARPKKTADKLMDWLFLHQDQMTSTTVRQAAADVGKITDFDAQYARAIQEVKTDAALGSSLQVNSTPSFFVNGRRIPGGGLSPQYFELLIELELKRAK
jgi:protein-disulfide isomerase